MMLLMMTFTPLLWAPGGTGGVPKPSTLAVLLLTGFGAALMKKFKK